MLKNFTAVISTNKNKVIRKAAIIGGVILGIGIGVLLHAGEDDSLVLVGEIEPEADYLDSTESDENATDDEK